MHLCDKIYTNYNMRNFFFMVIALCFCFNLQAQQENNEQSKNVLSRKHEVRLGTIKLLAGGIFEGSYEYIIDSNQSVGAHMLVNFDQGNEYFENHSITPYYRMYFQTKEDYGAKGFFVEGFTSFFLTDYELFDFSGMIDNNDVFDISIGLTLGKKWINTAGLVFEIRVGAGRNLLNEANFDALFKGDFSVGYRF